MLQDALAYPFRGGGWMMILIGALFSMLLDIGKFAPFFGLGAVLFSAGYFSAFYFDIVSTTVPGRNECPDWPDITSFWEDVMLPFLRILGVLLISFAPLLAFLIYEGESYVRQLNIYWSLVFAGCFYFPMAVIGVVAFGHLGGALPHRVLPAIIRALPRYTLPVIALVAAYVASIYAQDVAGRIRYFGWLLGSAISLYSLMVQARLIGLAYLQDRERIGWV